MKYSFPLLLLVGCSCATAPPPEPAPLPDMPPPPVTVESLRAKTVILVSDDGLCAAVWVAPRAVLTAAHCVDPVPQMITYEEYLFVGVALTGHETKLIATDLDDDLALLSTDDAGNGHVARVADASPPSGTEVAIVGHPFGLFYSYAPGWISGLRSGENYVGQRLQATGAVLPGNSGGGMFDDEGRLAGIASFVKAIQSPVGPTIPLPLSFFIPAEAIKAFLADHGVS